MTASRPARPESPETLRLRVTPKAKHNRIEIAAAEDGSPLYRVYVTAPPADGKANKAVIALLAKQLGLPKSALTISHGASGRDKTVRVAR